MRHLHKAVKQRTAFQIWSAKMRKHGLAALVLHPHHYVVASGLTVVMIVLGPHMVSAHIPHWLYAILENLSTLEEE